MAPVKRITAGSVACALWENEVTASGYAGLRGVRGQDRGDPPDVGPGVENMIEQQNPQTKPVTKGNHGFSGGNFVWGDWAGDVKCRHGHEVRLFNIGRGHWVACDQCRTCAFIGSNLMSSWRNENEAIWRKNHDSVRGYRQIE